MCDASHIQGESQLRAELVHHGDNDRAATDVDEIIARATTVTSPRAAPCP